MTGPSRCAMCGDAIAPPVTAYNESDDPVHEDCLVGAIDDLADALGMGGAE